MNIWAVGPLNGKARAFIASSNPADVLNQMQEGESVSPIPQNVVNDGSVIIIRDNLEYSVE
jgi:hypothetical protein